MLGSNCLNCGHRPAKFILCKECKEAGDRLREAIDEGLEIEYKDGTKVVYTWPDDPRN